MVNRVIEAKVLKMKKERRRRPKLNPVKKSFRPNKDVLSEYRERTRQLGVDEKEIDDWIKVLFGRPVFKGVPPERKAVLDLLSELREKEMEYLSFSLIQNEIQWCRCYFNSQRTCVILVHADFRTGKLRRSIEYGSIDRAVSRWKDYKVRWLST